MKSDQQDSSSDHEGIDEVYPIDDEEDTGWVTKFNALADRLEKAKQLRAARKKVLRSFFDRFWPWSK